MTTFRGNDARTGRSRRRRTASAFLALPFLLLAPTMAWATFHFAHIERMLTGVGGTTDLQFVQIEMEVAGQSDVSGSKLIAFDASGDFSHVVLTLNKDVVGGAGKSFLMASTAFESTTGMAPDFVFSTAGGNELPAEAGMVCWGKPGDETDPDDDDMVDCVSYGNYTGPDNVHSDAPSLVTPFGHGIERIQDTGSSADDFACEDPTFPVTNLPDKRGINASTSCDAAPECGNGTVEDPETCDDGDTDFAQGDFCSAECETFGCGIPSSTTDTEPKTSDALYVLRAAVGTVGCDLRVCDVNGSAGVNTTDALLTLRRAVGQEVTLDCTQDV